MVTNFLEFGPVELWARSSYSLEGQWNLSRP
jgi:hypothetical protein